MTKAIEMRTVTMHVNVPLLKALLVTAIENCGQWASVNKLQWGEDGMVRSCEIVEHEPSERRRYKVKQHVDVNAIITGLGGLGTAASKHYVDPKLGFQSAGKHLADALSGDYDAVTADVVLQMGIFGEIVYG